MNPSTSTLPLNEAATAKIEDLRQPVGLDAGAPEVTDTAEDVGGWHGGAEVDHKREQELVQEANNALDQDSLNEQERLKRPAVGQEVEMGRMALDDEAKRLVDAAMRADEI